MRIRKAPDYVVYGGEDTQFGPRPHPRLPPDAFRFWDHAGLYEADDGVAAYDHAGLAGWFRYTSMPDRTLCLAGTWIRPDVRRDGVAMRLWESAFRRTHPVGIYGVVASPEGEALVRAARRRWAHLTWDITFHLG